jgi:Bifunctional DNA primase/polymerase, N-terminal
MSAAADIYETAKAYADAGLSIMPIAADGTKRPAVAILPRRAGKPSWKCYQDRRPTVAELRDWFATHGGIHPPVGIAVIAGEVSGGLEIIDVDSWEYVKPWYRLVQKEARGLLQRLVMVRTPRPGLHVYYRCEDIGSNQKLAQIGEMDSETGKIIPKTIIETRGDGGYVLAPGSPPACHPTGRLYSVLRGKNLTQIPTITPAERGVLLDAARALSVWLDHRQHQQSIQRVPRAGVPDGDRPGDYFNARATWAEILEPHGWSLLDVDKAGIEHWQRPGKNSGQSATVNFAGAGLLHVFSSNAAPFDSDRSYSKFAAYVLLEHHGDASAAAKALFAEGYGQRQPDLGAKNRRRWPSPFDRYLGYTPPPSWT